MMNRGILISMFLLCSLSLLHAGGDPTAIENLIISMQPLFPEDPNLQLLINEYGKSPDKFVQALRKDDKKPLPKPSPKKPPARPKGVPTTAWTPEERNNYILKKIKDNIATYGQLFIDNLDQNKETPDAIFSKIKEWFASPLVKRAYDPTGNSSKWTDKVSKEKIDAFFKPIEEARAAYLEQEEKARKMNDLIVNQVNMLGNQILINRIGDFINISRANDTESNIYNTLIDGFGNSIKYKKLPALEDATEEKIKEWFKELKEAMHKESPSVVVSQPPPTSFKTVNAGNGWQCVAE